MKTPGLGGSAKKTAKKAIASRAKASDKGLANRGKIGAAKKTGAAMSKLQRKYDVAGMRNANKMGIYKDAITKANAIKDAKKRDAATANRGSITKTAAAKNAAAAAKKSAIRRARKAGM
jgi:hypothetical protein